MNEKTKDVIYSKFYQLVGETQLSNRQHFSLRYKKYNICLYITTGNVYCADIYDSKEHFNIFSYDANSLTELCQKFTPWLNKYKRDKSD